jgi:SAM-dependent methyltransferase
VELDRLFAAATDRNREPILEVLKGTIGPRARVLEIASGSGQHATFFAPRLRVAMWQPTDPKPESRASIDAWRAHLSTEMVAPAIALDVHARPWPIDASDPFHVVLCINMIHIAPWSACEALFAHAPSVLAPDGGLILYGPFKREGRHTAPSNQAFDERLRREDPSWGVRDLEDVQSLAERSGFALREIVPMPANNLTVIFERATG